MADYLKKKYGKEFMVRKLGEGDVGDVKGVVHPKDDPNLKFYIVRYHREGRKEPSYMENPPYMSFLWMKQKREEIKAISKNDLVSAGIIVGYSEEELYGRTISVKEAEQRFKKEMLLLINYGLFIDFRDFKSRIDEFDNFIKGKLSQEQAEDIYNIIKKLKNQDYATIKLKIRYFNGLYKKEINKKPEWYLYGEVSHDEDMSNFKKGLVLCSFEIDDLNQINKPDDVKRFIDLEAGYLYHDDSKDQN